MTTKTPKGFAKTYEKLPQTKEEQLKLAAEYIEDKLTEFFNQWGFPKRKQNVINSARTIKAPLASYEELTEYVISQNYVRTVQGINGKQYLLPWSVNLTKSQLAECMFKVDEVEWRLSKARKSGKSMAG